MSDTARSEFFAREAGDYLHQLEPLVGAGEPEGETLVRLARALRGAAMLAGPGTFTAAASELEQLAKQIRDGTLAWPTAASPVRDAVGRLLQLVGAAGSWNDERDREAISLAERLRRAAGDAAALPAPDPAAEQRGRRAFIAREAAAVAGAAELAARALAGAATIPADRLAAVTHAMHSLRGMAGLTQVPALPELLDALDAVIAQLRSDPAPPPGASDVFFAAAGALSRVARDVSEPEGVQPRLEEAGRFADLLHRMLCGPGAVVPIEHLLLADAAGSVQPYGGRANGPPPAGFADLVALGERLGQGAAQLRSAASPVAARLAAAQLIIMLRRAPGGLGTRPAGGLVARLLGALETGVAPHAPDWAALTTWLDRAGRCIAAGAQGDLVVLGLELDALGAELDRITGVAPDEVVPIEQLLLEDDVVPIQELLEDEPVPIESLAPDAEAVTPADRTGLERSLSTYSRLVRIGAPAVRFESLLSPGPAVVSGPVPMIPETGAGPVVPIHDLLYAGRSALMRADQVRRELERALRTAADPFDQVEPLVRELLDLVPLALADDR